MLGYLSDFLAWAPGPVEWIVILVIALLLFGKRLPDIAKGMGKSLTEFKRGLKEGEQEASKPADHTDQKPSEKI